MRKFQAVLMVGPPGAGKTLLARAQSFVGVEPQQVLVSPGLDLIIVRCGQTPVERRLHLVALYRRIIDLFRGAAKPG